MIYSATGTGLSRVLDALHPGGVFAMWADGLPDLEFEALLIEVFGKAEGRTVCFANPHTGGTSTSSVYLAGGTLAGRHEVPDGLCRGAGGEGQGPNPSQGSQKNVRKPIR